MKELEVLICIGIPAAGKSTWTKDYARRNSSWVRINRDDFRLMLKDQQMCEPKIESLVSKLQDEAIISALNSKLNVIIDNTNLKASYINHFIKLVEDRAIVKFRIFDISIDKAIERDANREKTVGEDVIRKMYSNYKILMDSFDFSNRSIKKKVYDNPKFLSNSSDKDTVILCDIDGTLAHMNGRRGPFEWHKVDRDDVDEILADRLKKHHLNKEKVILVTGRDESCRELTEYWLNYYNIPYYDLLMRKKDDFRKDSIIKQEIFEIQIKNQYNVLFVYDDRDQVVKMWRELGIKVFQVNEGNF